MSCPPSPPPPSRPAAVFVLFMIALIPTAVASAAPVEGAAPAGHAHLHEGGSPVASNAVPETRFFADLFRTYTPRQVCMNNERPVMWLHFTSDALIALAYFTIPAALVRFVRRRRDLAFNWMFVCFAVFILACGLTHVMNVLALWQAMYRADGLVKVVTAIASVTTAFLLWRLLPAAIALPSPSQLREANRRMEDEIADRRQAEEQLRQMQADLEQRVRQRTAELEAANVGLRSEVAAREEAEADREQLLESERRARADVERTSQMKDEFLATLSHELRTPLNAILGWSQILRARGAADGEALAEGLSVIERNARVQVQLIEDLLDMSRIISGKLRLDVQRVHLQEGVRAAIATVQHAADAKEIRLQVVLDPLVGPVRGDPNRLQQCFWNLLSNAIKFTPKGGRVQVGLQRVNSHLEVCVVDSGQGIAPAFLPHVFERFRQADATSTRQHGGLGLGLSIVRSLVEMHGGSVRADSAGEGTGATFCIELPVMVVHPGEPRDGRAHPRAPAPNAAPIEHPSLAGVSVLAVDDDPDARNLLRRVLEECGARVVMAGSAKEGLALVRAERPDMIVSDIGMPGEDGYAFIRQVRELKPDEGGRTPAAALTAFARAEDRTRALRAGFQMHMAKPIEPTELTAVVASLALRRGEG